MSLEENKEVVRRFVEAYNNQNLDLLDEILASDILINRIKLVQKGLNSS